MLTVKASVKPSNIHGLGVFTEEKISKGSVIWRFNPKFDIYFEPAEVEAMPKEQKEFVLRYAPLSTTTKKYLCSIDDSRFFNHSSVSHNMDVIDMAGEPEKVAIANRNIEKGEELLTNYREFDVHDENGKEDYLNT